MIVKCTDPFFRKCLFRDGFAGRCLAGPKTNGFFKRAIHDIFCVNLFCISDPQSWFMARLAYIRTTAAMSMVGYLLGLGDRHGENILFDTTNGDTIHVDLNMLFDKGHQLRVPETVPFRLTQNMVQAMGPTGTEGPFRLVSKYIQKHYDFTLQK